MTSLLNYVTVSSNCHAHGANGSLQMVQEVLVYLVNAWMKMHHVLEQWHIIVTNITKTLAIINLCNKA